MRIFFILIIFFIGNTIYGQPQDKFFTGAWKAWNDSTNRTDFQYIYLIKSNTSYYGPGVMVDGKEVLAPFLLTEIQEWKTRKDTLFLYSEPIPTDNKENTKSMTILFIIKDKGQDYFMAYMVLQDEDEMNSDFKEKFIPIIWKFEKQTY